MILDFVIKIADLEAVMTAQPERLCSISWEYQISSQLNALYLVTSRIIASISIKFSIIFKWEQRLLILTSPYKDKYTIDSKQKSKNILMKITIAVMLNQPVATVA